MQIYREKFSFNVVYQQETPHYIEFLFFCSDPESLVQHISKSEQPLKKLNIGAKSELL